MLFTYVVVKFSVYVLARLFHYSWYTAHVTWVYEGIRYFFGTVVFQSVWVILV